MKKPKDGSKTSVQYNLSLAKGNYTKVPEIQENFKCLVWPNPVKDILYLESDTSLTGSVSISDVTGKNLILKSLKNIKYMEIDIPAAKGNIVCENSVSQFK